MEYSGLHEKIRTIALKSPTKTAIEWGEKKVSYMELEDRANRIANFIYPKILENKNIPVILENSIELVEAILGLLKAGGVFAPVDPEFPENRIQFMIEKIDANWIITRRAWLEKLNSVMAEKNKKLNVLIMEPATNTSLEFENLNIYTLDEVAQKEPVFPSGIINKYAYIYFTSGSTGKPKAILGRHKSLQHFIEWEMNEFGVNESFQISQLTSPSFDPYLRDIFVPLCAGATLCIPESREIVFNPTRLKNWINKSRITLMHIVPTLFKALLEEVDDTKAFKNLQYILSAGEMLRGNDIQKLFQLFRNRIELVNLYGPTETTLAKLFYRVKEWDVERAAIPVGKAIQGAQVMILNEDMQLAEDGMIGEIYIRTPFISAGYYQDRDLTRGVFLKNPFSNNPKDIIYKTGDLGRHLSSGDIEILGRTDHQVKLRGFRVELGEIENALLKVEEVKEAVAVAKDDSIGGKYLCAYVETKGEELNVGQLRVNLQKKLPDYMIPNYFIQMDQMPHTPNGKIDRKALPEPKTMDTGETYIPPQNDLEVKLIDIWSQILKVDAIGVNHNFFNLGGHSLKAMQIIGLIQKEFGVAISLQKLFASPTVADLASEIAAMSEVESLEITPVPPKEFYQLSYLQKRLWLIHQLNPNSIAYNMTGMIILTEEIKPEILEKTLHELINRHDSLRTVFLEVDGEPMQQVLPNVSYKLDYLDISGKEEQDRLRQEIFSEINQRPFDLTRPPLIRGTLVKVGPEEYDFIYSMHHIISDGSSMEILRNEFILIYNRLKAGLKVELPQLTIQYKDFAEWQNKLLEDREKFRDIHNFWVKQLTNLSELNLPMDHPKEDLKDRKTAAFRVVVREESLNKLRAIGKEQSTSLFIVLLTGFKLYLATITHQKDIFLGIPAAGREQEALQNVIGFFVNTTLVRTTLDLEASFIENLKKVEANTLQTLTYQNYPLEVITDELKIPFPELSVFFNMLNMRENRNRELKDFDDHHLTNLQDVKFNQVYYLNEYPNGLEIVCNYLSGLFESAKVEYMVTKYVQFLEMIANDPNLSVKEYGKVKGNTKRKFNRSKR